MKRPDRGAARPTLAAAMLALGLAACGGDEGGGGGGGGGFTRPPTPVEVARVTGGEVANVFETVGSIEAVEAVTVVSEIGGMVRALPFREGDPVEKGTLLARLDDDELAAALSRAEALRDQRHTAWERVKRVVDEQAGTPQDLDDAAAALKVAEADVALASARLAKTRIRAPFAGLVGPRDVSPGAYIRVGQPIATLTQLDEIEVVFSVPERFTGQLQRGARVTITTPAYPGFEADGEITVVDPVLDADTRNARVIARVPNPDRRFRPGMSANVSAVLWKRDDALTIPSEAVFAQGDAFLAYVVGADSTVQPVPVELGVRLARSVEVLSGVSAGDRVVRAGHQKLYPGAKVSPIESAH
jgi:membrane fusion protein (multidrug efflux system)